MKKNGLTILVLELKLHWLNKIMNKTNYSEYRLTKDIPYIAHDLLYDELCKNDRIEADKRFNSNFSIMRDYIYICHSTGGIISRRKFLRELGINA